MFESTFVGHGDASGKSWPVVVSFLAQSLLVCVAILIPLLTTRSLPAQQWFSVLLEPPRPPAPAAPPAAEPQPRQAAPARIDDSVFRAPAVIPEKVALITDPEQRTAPAQDSGLRVVGVVPGGVPNSLFLGGRAPVIAPPPAPVVQPKQPAAPQRVTVGGQIQEALLVRKVSPVYPPLARQARISGTVRLQAIIGVDGAIRELRVLSGHPLLVRSALDAVQQWRYRPTELNNQPVEVLTQIEVNYTLR
jgi:protein TonB